MKIVRFKDGTYGIRKWFGVYWYKDLRSSGTWWVKNSPWFGYCKGNRSTVLRNLETIIDSGKIISKEELEHDVTPLNGMKDKVGVWDCDFGTQPPTAIGVGEGYVFARPEQGYITAATEPLQPYIHVESFEEVHHGTN